MAERGATGSTIRAVGTRHGPIGALPVTRPGAALGATHVVGQGTPFTGAPARPASPVPGEEVGLRSAERHRMILEANRRFVEASPGAAGVRRRPGESSALRARLAEWTWSVTPPCCGSPASIASIPAASTERSGRAWSTWASTRSSMRDVDAPHAGGNRLDLSCARCKDLIGDAPAAPSYFGDPLAFDDRLRGAGRDGHALHAPGQ